MEARTAEPGEGTCRVSLGVSSGTSLLRAAEAADTGRPR